jgi:hypothetical protein
MSVYEWEAVAQGLVVLDDHVYADQAQSGARSDRVGLNALITAARANLFEAVMIDDLSRFARDNYLMLSVLAELNFEGVRVISVADGLDNEKYNGCWVWNKKGTRKDPKSGRRRHFVKPESEWVINEDESLRIVPAELWDKVRDRRKKVRRSWPGGKGKRGFSGNQGSRQQQFPTHLFSGAMVCGVCGAAIALISGESGGYYGCLGAAKGSCENKMLVRRRLVENVITDAVREQISSAEQIRYVLERVEKEVHKLYAHVPETIRLKEMSCRPRIAGWPTSSNSLGKDEAVRCWPRHSSRLSVE